MIGLRLKYFIMAFIICNSFSFSAELRIIDAKKGANAGDRFGDKCEGLGDVNGDGFGDFLVAEYAT
ncbi:MAG: hypothetical protein GY841_19300 [FCB group bacterium]|nr:hypothetical protein [FCB group bacterium]